jgi:MFS family permease
VQIIAVGNVNQIIAGRAIQGYAAGGGSVNGEFFRGDLLYTATPLSFLVCCLLGAMFLAEISPKAIRGLLGAFLSLNIMLGVALGYWMNYLAILHINSTSNWQWRFPVLFQMVGFPGHLLLVDRHRSDSCFITTVPGNLDLSDRAICRGIPEMACRQRSHRGG